MPERAAPRPFPLFSLEACAKLAVAIQESNAGRPMNRHLLAEAISRKSGSSDFRDLLSSSYKYGLTTGTEKAKDVSLTERGVHITRPTTPEEKSAALQAAALAPETLGRIYRHYDNARLPSGPFFQNVLEREFKVPREHTGECEKLLLENGRYAGLIRTVSGSPFVMMDAGVVAGEVEHVPSASEAEGGKSAELHELPGPQAPAPPVGVTAVFISHGRNKKLLEQVKHTIEFGKLRPIIAEEQEATAIPVPAKVIAHMRECQAGVIIVSADNRSKTNGHEDEFRINENVLIEIGAATVLYNQRVILLWDRRIEVPTNLQGLYRCEFEGDSLDWETGIKLQKQLALFRDSTV